MSHPWRRYEADKHLGGSESSSRGPRRGLSYEGEGTVILSDLSRERRGASVDHSSHSGGGETQLGHELHSYGEGLCNTAFQRRGANNFRNYAAEYTLISCCFFQHPQEICSRLCVKVLMHFFLPLQVLLRFPLKGKRGGNASREERRQSCWPTL